MAPALATAAAAARQAWRRGERELRRPRAWAALAALDLALSLVIVRRVAYTEIDWKAYMQEVEGPLVYGQWDYAELRGDTGPLVYPAGFVWLFAALRWATGQGRDVLRAQYLFSLFHAALVFLVLGTLFYDRRRSRAASASDSAASRSAAAARSRQQRGESGDPNTDDENEEDEPAPVPATPRSAASHASDDSDDSSDPDDSDDASEGGAAATTSSSSPSAARRTPPPWVALAVLASRRVHSIFCLRLFNDGTAMLLMYLCTFLLVRRRWAMGVVAFSLALSVKMNILTFAPGLAVILLDTVGLARSVRYAAVCVAIQVGLALPFLRANWRSYLSRAFEFGRVFSYEWTVNFRFLPEELFLSRRLAAALLALTLAGWLAFGQRHFSASHRGGLAGQVMSALRAPTQARWRPRSAAHDAQLTGHVALVLSTSNMVGIAFARSIHYQFYCWYFHTLAYLCHRADMSLAQALPLLAAIEWAYNVFPSTPASSAALQAAHLVLLAKLWLAAPARLKALADHEDKHA
jgi:hypothetical protein